MYGISVGVIIGLIMERFKGKIEKRDKPFLIISSIAPFIWGIAFYAHTVILKNCLNTKQGINICNELTSNDFYFNSPVYIGLPLIYFILRIKNRKI